MKKNIAIITLSIALLLSIVFNSYNTSQIKQLKQDSIYQKNTYETLQDNFNYLMEYCDGIETDLIFYQKLSGIITPTGNCYHRFGCPTLHSSSDILIYSESLCQALGYSKCQVCSGNFRRYSLPENFRVNVKEYCYKDYTFPK